VAAPRFVVLLGTPPASGTMRTVSTFGFPMSATYADTVVTLYEAVGAIDCASSPLLSV